MNIWLVMLLGGLLTFGMRLSFIYLLARLDVHDVIWRALRFVPPAVLSALVMPALLMPAGHLDLSFGNFDCENKNRRQPFRLGRFLR